MSQNNYTLIEQKERNVYEISNRNADTNESGRVYTVKTLEEAVKKANEIEEKCWLGSSEYGIKISLLNKREINRQEKQEEWKEGLDNIDLMLAMLQSIENCTDEAVRNTAKAIREELDKVSQLLSESKEKAKIEVLEKVLEKKTNYSIEREEHGYRVTLEYVLADDIKKEIKLLKEGDDLQE